MEMLKFAEQFIKIKAVLFDKGFYSAKIVNELESKKIGYNKYELRLKVKVARDVYEYDWIILTNLGYRNTTQLVNLYRKRWNIENIFRSLIRLG